MCLLTGISQAEEVFAEEAILECCVQITVPRWEWARQCEAEMRRQGLSSCALQEYLRGEYYEYSVATLVRDKFRHAWTPAERRKYAFHVGDIEIDDANFAIMGRLVIEIGQALPAAVTRNAWRR